MGELQYWVRSLRSDPHRSLQVFPHGCNHVCRDECLALSIVSAQQHGDSETAEFACRHLVSTSDWQAISLRLTASASFADALLETGHALLGVPRSVVLGIVSRDRPCRHGDTIIH